MTHRQDGSNWGEWIYRERKRRGWTQQQLAIRVGTTSVSVVRWEHNIVSPGPAFQAKLIRVFQMEQDIVIPVTNDSTVFSIFSGSCIIDPAIPTPPTLPTGLIGRDTVLQHLKSWLHSHSGACALRGMHGVGKTALSTALAHDPDIRRWFPGGILWAALGVEPNILELLSRWGTLFNLAPSTTVRLTTVTAWQNTLRDVLGSRRMLLIIDDAWTADAALAFRIGNLNCVQLVTTRSKEVAFDFTGDSSAITDVEELGEGDSIELLRTHAPEIVQRYPDDAKQLVHAMGGLPLGLSIIGRYLRRQLYCGYSTTIKDTINQLYDAEVRLKLAISPSPSERPPHLTNANTLSLDATIEVSDRQLKEQARQALRALSVFLPKPASFSQEAALAIAEIPESILAILVDAGLLERGGQARYTLHQTIADWTKSQRQDARVEARMVQFYGTFIKEHQADYTALEGEKRHIFEAFKLACQQKMLAELIRGMNAFTPFLEAKGSYILVKEYLLAAESLALTMEENKVLAEVYLHLGRIAELTGKLSEAQSYYEKGLQLAREMKQRETICALLAHCGQVLVNAGNHIEAEPFLLEGLQLAQEFNRQRLISGIMRNLGEVIGSRGENDSADEWYQQGLAIARQEQDGELISIFLQNLGVNAQRRGDYAQATLYYKEGMQYAHEMRHEQRMSAMEMNLGMLAFDQEQYDSAESFYLTSLERARRIHNPMRISSVLQNLGMLEGVRHHFERADRYFQESLDIAIEIEHTWLVSETLCEWGDVYLRRGKIEAARSVFERALKQAQEIEGPDLIAIAQYGLARVAFFSNDYASALRLGKESLDLLKKIGNKKARDIEQWLQQPVFVTSS